MTAGSGSPAHEATPRGDERFELLCGEDARANSDDLEIPGGVEGVRRLFRGRGLPQRRERFLARYPLPFAQQGLETDMAGTCSPVRFEGFAT